MVTRGPRVKGQSPAQMPRFCSASRRRPSPALLAKPKGLRPGEKGCASFVHSGNIAYIPVPSTARGPYSHTSPTRRELTVQSSLPQAGRGSALHLTMEPVLGCRVAAQWSPHLLLSSLPEPQERDAP